MGRLNRLCPAPDGITLAGIVIAKRNPDGSFAVKGREKEIHALLQVAYGKRVAPQVLGYIRRGAELLAGVCDTELEYADYPFSPNPHARLYSGNDFPVMAKALMMFALTGLNDVGDPALGKARLMKMQRTLQRDALLKSYGLPTWEELTKDDNDDDDESDDEEGDDEEEDGDGSESGDSDSSSSDDNSDFDSKHPRWPAGSAGGIGGEFAPKDEGEATTALHDALAVDAEDTTAQISSVTPTSYETTQAAASVNTATPVNTNIGLNDEGMGQVNIFVGGFGDDWFSQIVENSRSLTQINENGTYGTNFYFTYTDASQINALIASLPDDTTINLIGHSYGGATAAQVATNPVNEDKIDTLVTIDPVGGQDSYGRLPNYSDIADSVGQWVDVNATGNPNGHWYDISNGNAIAGFGGAWNNGPSNYADTFISAPVNHADFDDMMNAHIGEEATARQILNNQ